ncbi:hypothetical protein PCLA_04r0684 [Pseudomonas citronellolis]|uniref:SIR2 family protein n=1 Tax=Pseudomonas citronellolis TaxID=53408 RepID=UPI000EEFB1DC|nr:SIR2 family protein [Pseudomonas citronellolis]GBL56065.1 hypothetical protein PCLA_04r0684 [Pseudomonas citronellolis]
MNMKNLTMEIYNKFYSPDNGNTSHRYIQDAFIINILKTHIERQGKKFLLENNQTQAIFDAYAPEGFDDIPGPLYIDITSTLTPTKAKLIEKEFIKATAGQPDARLLIIPLHLPSLSHEKNLPPELTVKNSPITIWGPEELKNLISKYPSESEIFWKKPFTLRLETALTKQQENWREERENLINIIRDRYNSGLFSLFVGAGVSSSAGLPDWNTLLNSLFVSLLTSELNTQRTNSNEEIAAIVKRLREVDGTSALMSARYIRKGMSNGTAEQSDFINSITERLYTLRDKRKPIDSQLIKSIITLCTPGRTGAKVKSVITYNFDDLVERELEKRNLSYKSIFEETEVAIPEELPIYHVHGYLPEDRSQYQNLEKSTLVFSEEGYHKIYKDPYHWSNLTQLNTLKESTCMMIGLSMSDPNLRRLLEISAQSYDKPKHYAFMRRINIDKFSNIDENKTVNASASTIKKFLDRHHTLNEELFKELGVNIIWYEQHEEIPKIIAALTKQPSNKLS